MKIQFLGTGTSVGVPMIGCDCEVCTSDNPRNQRSRASIVFKVEGKNLLVDTSTDLRFQAIRTRLRRVDAVLFTHAHADHTRGFDELRAFNFIQSGAIDCFASAETADNLRRSFEYIFVGGDAGSHSARVNLTEITGPFSIDGVPVTPIPLTHGNRTIFGYRIGNSAYLTDCNRIPEDSYPLLEGLDLLILDALRHKPHPTHFCLSESLIEAEKIGAKKTLFTHMSHDVEYNETNPTLPEGVSLAHDTLEVDCL